MSALSRVHSWWKWMIKREQLESEMDAELQFHLKSCAEDLMRNGTPEADAIRQARIALGGFESHKDAMRDSVGHRWWDELWIDLHYGARMLGKNPTFALVIVLTLGLSIGANSAIFSVIDGVLLKPLPYPQAERIARVFYRSKEYPKFPLNPWDFLDFRARNQTFESFAIYTHSDVQLSGMVGDPVKLSAFRISSGYFRVLGVQPARGREFDFSEEWPGNGNVVILSDRVWRNQFASASGILGRKVLRDSRPYTVVGVMPAGLSPRKLVQLDGLWRHGGCMDPLQF